MIAAVGMGVVVGLCLTAPVNAGERYSFCKSCHGDFTDGTSPKVPPTVFPSDNKHTMHRGSSFMNTECDLCHSDNDNVPGGRDPFIGSSNGTADNPGLGCTGCHTVEGMRLHHEAAGVPSCIGCHGPQQQGTEDMIPTYYGTVDTNADDPCNLNPVANSGENWSVGDLIGLDNDGDGVYDGNDPDCAVCAADFDGDGMVATTDLLSLLGVWGACPGCVQDLDGDGFVATTDLLALLAAWGPC